MSRTAKTLEDKRKLEQEKLNGCLMELLKEEDNRYCADCDAKGPRWASWNLGVFLCIRCAGIHRNLGVHVSKVKSINLDSWTAEQVQSVRVMGNCKARAVYEANLPEHFRRPHSDSSMEAFIRAKYDQKRYIMKDWVKPKVNVEDLSIWEELQDIARGGTGSKRLAGVSSSMKPVKSAPQLSKNQPSKLSPGAAAPPPAQPPTPSAINDLVDLAPVAPDSWNKQRPVSSGGAIDDLLGLNAQNVAEQPSLVGSHTCFAVKQEEEEEETTSAESNPVFLEGVQAVSNGEMTGSNLNQQLLFGQNEGEKKTKTDIMALYGSGRSQTSGGGMGMGGFYQTGPGGFDPHSGNPNFHGHPMNQQQIQYPPGMQMGGYYCAGPFQGQQQTVAGPYFRGYQPNFTSSGYTGFPGGSPAQYTVGMMGQQQISSPVAGGYGVQSVQNQFATMGFQQPARATGNTLATNLWQ